MHLIIDTYCERLGLITSRQGMAGWLKMLAIQIDMTPTGDPYILGYPWPDGSDHDALTCFLPIGESGISVHCYPEKKFVFIDIFSCKDFDVDKTLDFVCNTLEAHGEKTLLLSRGVREGEIEPVSVILMRRKIEYGSY